jgi:hypothetical protein
MSFAVFPFSFIHRSIRKSTKSLPIVLSVQKVALVSYMGGKGDSTPARSFGVGKVTNVDRPILPRHGSIGIVCHIVHIHTIVCATISMVGIDSMSFSYIIVKYPFEGISIRVTHAPSALSSTLFKRTVIDIPRQAPSHFAVAIGSKSTHFLRYVSGIKHLDSIIVQELMVLNLLALFEWLLIGGGTLLL